ncbi:MAG: class I SAM-dependent methyltransferase [Actinomycetaceae bacterium]|nr:class I SAM-dependent methyltransferase [Actinomycetaceae bacterium]
MTNPLALVLEPNAWALLEAVTPLGIAGARDALGDLDADTRAAIVTQVELRAAAQDKFGEFARSLLLTRDGLEQATRLAVGALHARRFRDGGCTVVADLGCGIGADALAIAGLGLGVRAWDIDESAVSATTVNLRFFPNCTVTHGDVTALSMRDLANAGVDGVFADPARRTGSSRGNQRIHAPEHWSPPLSAILAWREHGAPADRLGVKVAPGIDYRVIPADMHAQWVSIDKSVVEASLWTPAMSNGPGRSAVVFRGSENLEIEAAGDPSAPAPSIDVATLGSYLWEVDGAVVRAGLLREFAESAGALGIISPSIAFLTSEERVTDEWKLAVSEFEILAVTSLKPKAIAGALASFTPTDIEVKKRGADISPETLRRTILKACGIKRPSGENVRTIFATRVGGQHRAIIAHRLNLP